MSISHTQAVIATAQCMTDGDALDFIDEHVSVADLMEWIEEIRPVADLTKLVVHGAIPKEDDDESSR